MSTHLDKTAIDKIEELVLKTIQPIQVPGEEKGVYYLRQPDGTLKKEQSLIDPRKNTAVYDLESLGRELESYQSIGNLEGVYVSDREVVACIEEAHRRQTVTLNLPHHPVYERLLELRRVTAFSQKALVRLLRTELADYIDPKLVTIFQELKIVSNSEANVTQRPTSAALDQNILKAVQGRNGTAVPEVIEVQTPVYDLPETRNDTYPISIYVEFDHESQQFELIAVHNELKTSQEMAVRKIITDIENDSRIETHVLYGSPR